MVARQGPIVMAANHICERHGTCVQNVFGLMVPALLRDKTRIFIYVKQEATKVRAVEGLEAGKEAIGKKCDEAAISGDRGTYAPEFNQLPVDTMTTITIHKAHSRSYKILLLILQKQFRSRCGEFSCCGAKLAKHLLGRKNDTRRVENLSAATFSKSLEELGLSVAFSICLDGGSFDNMRVNLGIDISRKAGEVPVVAINIKSKVDGAIEQDKSNTLTQVTVGLTWKDIVADLNLSEIVDELK
ncbi:hypothetical protein Tco_1393606 [Tanacetum coccineum]